MHALQWNIIDVCIYCQFLQALKILVGPKHSISAIIEGNIIDIIYVGELEIHTVLSYHCAIYSVWPNLLLIVLFLALNAKSLDTPDLRIWAWALEEIKGKWALFGKEALLSS